MKIEFMGSVAVITPDLATSRQLYVDAIGLPLEGGSDYLHSERIAGSKSFGVWPLADAAQACFGTAQWPAELPVPQASIEFEVADAEAVAAAGEELRAAGYELLHPARKETLGTNSRALALRRGADRRDLLRTRAARLRRSGLRVVCAWWCASGSWCAQRRKILVDPGFVVDWVHHSPPNQPLSPNQPRKLRDTSNWKPSELDPMVAGSAEPL